MNDLKSFFKESAIPVENVKYIASERFKGTDGKPIEWELRPISSEEFEEITNSAKRKVPDPQNPRSMMIITDNSKINDKVLIAGVVYPNLRAEELQNSWGTVGELATLRAMLLPGELSDLANMITQISGFDIGMEDKIKKVKKQ